MFGGGAPAGCILGTGFGFVLVSLMVYPSRVFFGWDLFCLGGACRLWRVFFGVFAGGVRSYRLAAGLGVGRSVGYVVFDVWSV